MSDRKPFQTLHSPSLGWYRQIALSVCLGTPAGSIGSTVQPLHGQHEDTCRQLQLTLPVVKTALNYLH